MAGSRPIAAWSSRPCTLRQIGIICGTDPLLQPVVDLPLANLHCPAILRPGSVPRSAILSHLERRDVQIAGQRFDIKIGMGHGRIVCAIPGEVQPDSVVG